MINKIKANKYQTLELIIIFLITLAFNLFCIEITMDETWNYGFSYNIANGLIPYKDFNMVITPLFPIIGAIFMSVFGKSVIVYHVFNALICTTIFKFFKDNNHKSYYLIYSIFLFFSLPNYNVFLILLLYILMMLEKRKTNDYIIGIILGLTFLTKQNMGIYLAIPTLFTKDIKKILKRIIGFIIPNIIILIYLLYSNSLFEFINYAFLGIKEFAKQNQINSYICIIIVLINTIYLIKQYIKDKNIETIYLLSFQLLVFPMIEPYHTAIAIIPSLAYFLNKLKLNKKIIKYTFIIFITLIFSVNIYNIYQEKTIYPNTTTTFKYRRLDRNQDIGIKEISDYITNKEDEEIYLITAYAYLIKLEANIKINQYDLIINGNIGKNGSKKIIQEIKNNCNNKKCTFLVDKQPITSNQEKLIVYNKDVVNYICKYYKEKEKLSQTNLYIYQNY